MFFAYIHDKRQEIMKWPIVIVLDNKQLGLLIITFAYFCENAAI